MIPTPTRPKSNQIHTKVKVKVNPGSSPGGARPRAADAGGRRLRRGARVRLLAPPARTRVKLPPMHPHTHTATATRSDPHAHTDPHPPSPMPLKMKNTSQSVRARGVGPRGMRAHAHSGEGSSLFGGRHAQGCRMRPCPQVRIEPSVRAGARGAARGPPPPLLPSPISTPHLPVSLSFPHSCSRAWPRC